jgi:hypothetical protein
MLVQPLQGFFAAQHGIYAAFLSMFGTLVA